MVRSVFVGHNNRGRQRAYIDSHYLDNIVSNAVIIDVHLCLHSEHNWSINNVRGAVLVYVAIVYPRFVASLRPEDDASS
jgi:hypothetical protein